MFKALKKWLVGTPLGYLLKVENKERYRTADKFYYVVKVWDEETDSILTLFLTREQLNQTLVRTKKNQEDIPRGIL